MTPDELKIVRQACAKRDHGGCRGRRWRVETAFAAVPREDFLGPGPWPIFRMRRDYVPTPTADPVYLYTDEIVGISPSATSTMGSLHFMPFCFRKPPCKQASISCMLVLVLATILRSWRTSLPHPAR